MSVKYKDSLNIFQSNDTNMKDIIKAEIVDDSNYKTTNVINSMLSKTSSGSPCIIRIVPSKKANHIPSKSLFKTIKGSEYLYDMPSTSQLETSDHEYLKRNIELELRNNDKSLNKVSNNEPVNVITPLSERRNIQTSITNSSKRPIGTEISSTVVPEKKSKVHSEKCCCACREILEDVQKKQDEILSYLKNGYHFMPKEKKLDLLPNMPFNDMNDFLDFDESLTHENVQDQFLIKLKKLLVSAEQKSVSNIMSCIMTNELCRAISWIGIKDTLAFGSTNMVMLIVDLLQEHHQLEIDIVKARIAEWLRRCGDRIGNEIRKQKKKEGQGFSPQNSKL